MIRTPTSTVAALAVPSACDSEPGARSHAATSPRQNGRPTNSAQPYAPSTVIESAARAAPSAAVMTTPEVLPMNDEVLISRLIARFDQSFKM